MTQIELCHAKINAQGATIVQEQPTGENRLIPDRDRPTAVTFTDDHLHITLANGRMVHIPVDNFPTLKQATPEQRVQVQCSLAGLYWSELNLDISLLEILSGTASPIRSHKPRFCEG